MKHSYLLKGGLLSLVLLIFATLSFAQTKVSGRVVSGDDDEPIPGVNIIEKGTANGTITDGNGNYSIQVEGPTSVLQFSFVGYQATEQPVGNQSTIDISMAASVSELSEVVVIGYGAAKKEDLTGSVKAISTADFNQGSITSPQELLNGKVPGVQITNAGGAPGAESTIRIRGGSSLTASNDPLIVIDGVPIDNQKISGMNNNLNTINPNDIETFTVLKDASATAIYGSRASNGVIIITTKKGRAGGLSFDYNGNVAVNTVPKTIDNLTTTQFRDLYTERFGNDPDLMALLGDAQTDWQDAILRTSVTTDHNASVSGSIKDWLPYRASVGYSYNEGILKTSELERFTGNINLNPKFFDDHLKVDMSLKGMNIENRFADTGTIFGAIGFDPTQVIRDETEFAPYGGYFTWLTPNGQPIDIAPGNPVATLQQKTDRSTVNRFIGNVQLDYKLHFLPELHVNLNLGTDRSKAGGNVVTDPMGAFDFAAFQNGGANRRYDEKKRNELLDLYLQYIHTFEETDLTLDVMGGYSYQHFWREQTETDVFGNGNIRNPEKIERSENFLISFFGRMNLNWKSKYLITATLRNDNSSRFSEDNRAGIFPSLAASWNINNEAFLKESQTISQLKLRLGYGITGQQDIGADYGYLGIYTRGQTTAQAIGYDANGNPIFVQTIRPEGYDENLKWETTTTYNAGIDFGFFDDRLTGSLDGYYRITDDLLNEIPIAAGSNLSNQLVTNVGSLENKGFEFSLDGVLIQNTDWYWTLGVNATYNENEITKLTQVDDPSYKGVETGDIEGGTGNRVQIHSVGYPAFSFYVLEQIYDDNGKPIEGAYVDRDNNGIINDDDRYRYKNSAPAVLLGINSRLTYHDWDFSFSGRASIGNYVYNNVNSNSAFYNNLQVNGRFTGNTTTDIYNTNFQNPQYFSDYYVEDASYFRLDNVMVGYNFHEIFGGKWHARVYATVNNVFVLSGYSGLDPEVFNGIDRNVYPRPRTFLLGVNLGF